MGFKILRPNFSYSYTLKDGTVVKYDTAFDLGQAAAKLGFNNPYEPMTFEYDSFENGKEYEKSKQGGAE